MENRMSTMVYDEGREAFWRGLSHCPYADIARRAAWSRGWKEAESDNDASPAHTIGAFGA